MLWKEFNCSSYYNIPELSPCFVIPVLHFASILLSTVQTFSLQSQYVFVHDALDELIKCEETDINVRSLKSKIDHLHDVITDKGSSGFDTQYQVLCAFTYWYMYIYTMSTVCDFWRLIWEYKSTTIVQLCCLEENKLVSSWMVNCPVYTQYITVSLHIHYIFVDCE